MRIRSFVSCVLLTACASGSGGSTSDPGTTVAPMTETVRITGSGQPGGTIEMGMTVTPAGAWETSISDTPEAVWSALPAAYESLGIAVTLRDPSTKSIGNLGLRARRRIGNTAASQYFDCGNTQGAPSADTYDMYVTVRTQVIKGNGAGSTISSTAEAQAKPVAFSGDYVHCGSSGVLEKKIADAVRARLNH